MYTTCKVIVLFLTIYPKQELSFSPNCRCSCHKGNGAIFRLRLAKLSITFLKKENDKVVRESVNEELKKKNFLFNLRILISKIVLGFFYY